MGNSTFTPGPWDISSRPAQLVSTDGQVIALAIGYDSENLQENARLIAAAPDLYAALTALLYSFTEPEDDNEDLRVARRAIAKVEGR